MRRDLNVHGRTYSLIVLAPVAPGRSGDLRRALAALPTGAASPFAAVPGTHVARFTRLELDAEPHLVLAADVDGPSDGWLDLFLAATTPELDAVLACCVGWPGPSQRAAAVRWVRDHQLDAGFNVIAYPRASVQDVRTALDIRRRLAALALEARTIDPRALRARWREVMDA